MKVITNGTIYELRDDRIGISDKLPAQTYVIRCSPMTGFYMEKYSDIEVKESKIYGVHTEKVNKVLNAFDTFERNLGIILSGNKGIGKSLFAKLLSIEAIKKGLPLIVVDSFIPGIASYIEKIDQEVVILFDEFDKTFGNIRTSENEADPQAGLLSLFDGVSSGKKMFIITCNELRNLNDYLINRPGRFHYHFRFDYPNELEIKEYLMDKIEPPYYSGIDKVIAFSKRVPLNYDCLRAISFELNRGESFESVIKDLNIINMNAERYNLILHFEGGTVMTAKKIHLDLFGNDDDIRVYLYDSDDNNIVDVEFYPADCSYDMVTGNNIVQADKLKLLYQEDCKEELVKKTKALKPKYLMIQRCQEKSLHYLV